MADDLGTVTSAIVAVELTGFCAACRQTDIQKKPVKHEVIS